MESKETQKRNTPFGNLFGEPTPAKASGLAFSVATLLPTVLSFFFLLILAVLGLGDTEDYQTADWFLYANYLLPQISFALVTLAYLRYRQTSVGVAVKKQACKPVYFFVAIILQIGLFGLSELNSLFIGWLQGFGYEDGGILLPSVDGLGFWGVLLVVGVLAATLEEIVFRGVVLDGLKKNFSLPVAVVVCGGMFAIYHQNPAQTLYQFCCGAAFALVALRSGSVLPTAIAHFINNAVILILYKVGVTELATPVVIAVVCVSIVCLIGALGYLIFLDKNEPIRTERQKQGAERKKFFLFSAVGIAVCVLTWLFVLFTGM